MLRDWERAAREQSPNNSVCVSTRGTSTRFIALGGTPLPLAISSEHPFSRQDGARPLPTLPAAELPNPNGVCAHRAAHAPRRAARRSPPSAWSTPRARGTTGRPGPAASASPRRGGRCAPSAPRASARPRELTATARALSRRSRARRAARAAPRRSRRRSPAATRPCPPQTLKKKLSKGNNLWLTIIFLILTVMSGVAGFMMQGSRESLFGGGGDADE
jgi:hypothetical protein